MATGVTRTITGTLNLTDKYQLTDYDDTLTINNAQITFLDPAGDPAGAVWPLRRFVF